MQKLEEEVAKAAGQILIDTAQDGRRAAWSLFGDAVGELGKTLGDEARFFRFKNLLRLGDKVEAIRRERGLTAEEVKALPFGDALRVVEAASMEEDEDVQDLWARLIANATASDGDQVMKKSYIDLLKSLSGLEAVFIDLLWNFRTTEFRTKEDLDAYNAALTEAADARWRKFRDDDRRAALQNLLRLRVISVRPRTVDAGGLLGKAPREMIDAPFQDWSFVDARKFGPFMEQLVEQIATANGSNEVIREGGVPLHHQGFVFRTMPWQIDAPEMHYLLTSLGNDLMTACDIKPGPEVA